MRYHDLHLSGYTVSDFGSRIVLHLVSEYPGRPREESHIEFSDVACYHFVHTTSAVMTDLQELPVAQVVKQNEVFLSATAKDQGLKFWKADVNDYLHTLEKEGFRAWKLGSAIGFTGFIVAKQARQLVAKKLVPEPQV